MMPLWPAKDVHHWMNAVCEITVELQHTKAPIRQLLIGRGLYEVNNALEAARDAAVAAKQAADPSNAAAAHTRATADAAMQELLAAEEGKKAVAAAPSKAAEKRARKKATARAAAAAAAVDAVQPKCAQPSKMAAGAAHGIVEVHSASNAAASVQCVSLADSLGEQADPLPSSTAGRPNTLLAAATAPGKQQHHLQPRPPLASLSAQQQQRLQWMLCPITKGVMVHATVCVGDGHSYEESAISEWLNTRGDSPVTGQPLPAKDLLPNHALRQMILAAGA